MIIFIAGVRLPIYVALCLNQCWIVMLPGYIYHRNRLNRRIASTSYNRLTESGDESIPSHVNTEPSPSSVTENYPLTDLLKVYVGMGIVVCGVTFFRSYGVSYLPGSQASILLATSIIFNMILSYLILKRKFNKYHIASAIIGLFGVVSLAVGKMVASSSTTTNTDDVDTRSWIIGSVACLIGAMFIALMSVLSSKITTQWPHHKQLRVTEMTVVSSLIAVIFLIPLLFITQEYKEWVPAFENAWYSSSPIAARFLVGLSVTFPFTKSIVRSSKYSTIAHSSAFVFEIVQAAASIGAAVVNIFIFNEPFNWSIIVAILLMGIAFLLYLRGQAIARQKANKEDTNNASATNISTDKGDNGTGNETPTKGTTMNQDPLTMNIYSTKKVDKYTFDTAIDGKNTYTDKPTVHLRTLTSPSSFLLSPAFTNGPRDVSILLDTRSTLPLLLSRNGSLQTTTTIVSRTLLSNEETKDYQEDYYHALLSPSPKNYRKLDMYNNHSTNHGDDVYER